MTKKIDVKYYSQHSDDISEEWRRKSCAIACVKMILDFMDSDDELSGQDLVDEGLVINGFSPEGHGWIHESLVRLLHNHGVSAYRQEFKSYFFDKGTSALFDKKEDSNKIYHVGLNKIIKSLKNNSPVIVSLGNGFNGAVNTHMVLLTGTKETKENGIGGFFYHDPNSKTEMEFEHAFMAIDTFKKYWRKMAIFVEN